MDRLFLDANILFSVAWRPDSGLHRLWELPDVELITSDYAVEEAFRNLPTADRRERLTRFLTNVSIITEWHQVTLPDDIELREKDVPILQAAIASNATHLITGDKQDFGIYFNQTVEGVTILQPATYLRDHS